MEFDLRHYRLNPLSFSELLSEEEYRLAYSHSTEIQLKRGQLLFKEGSFPKGIYIIQKGKVKIYNTNEEGRLTIIYIYQKSEFFGYRPMLAGERHPVSAAALDNTVITFIPKRVFELLVESSVTLPRRLLSSIASEFTVWIHKLAVFSQYSVKSKVALTLLVIGNYGKGGSRRRNKISISVARADLAAYAGTALETFVRMLKVFKNQGIVKAAGRQITVTDCDALLEQLNM
jgi:CRP-like cAMP-binding protein